MSSVDNRIVSMKFDNAAFERGVSTTMGTLAKLKNSLNFSGSSKGLNDLQSSVDRFNIGPIQGAVTGVSKSFVAMSTVAITALSAITSKALAVGTGVAKSLTLDPVASGFDEYELKLGSIQTIMAGSGESLQTVTGYLKELNEYSDKTIYSFKDMTSNIGKFTNAGVDLDRAVESIQGIANVAAISGANAEEASRAMYNFAQSLSQGSVKLMDWKSIELANMATKEFKTELLESAVAAGTLTKGADGLYTTLKGTPVTATKGFNESLSEQWLTSEALVETLGRYSDTSTDIGKRATAAAQDVKTFTQMMDTLKESAGSGWAETSELLFGNFDEAKELWTGVNNVLGGIINSSADARNKMLGDWKALGGRTALIDSIKNAFEALGSVLKPIKEAFRDIFPAMTGQRLFDMTEKLREFTSKLKLSDESMENIRRTARGFFAILSIGWQIIKGVAGVIGTLLGTLVGSGGGFLDLTGNIGDFLVSIDNALKKGDLLSGFFKGLGKILEIPIMLLGALGDFLSGLFGGFDKGAADDVSGSFDKLGDRLSPLTVLGDRVSEIFDKLPGTFDKVKTKLKPVTDAITNAFKAIGSAIANAFSGDNFETTLDTINTGLFAGILLIIKKFLKNGLKLDPSGGLIESIKGTFGALTDTLTVMQTNIKANVLLKIAGAIAILTASVISLSLIDSDKLTKALGALGVTFAQLLGAMAILVKIAGSAGFVKVPMIAAAMVLLATAVLILSSAVKKLSKLSWSELLKGLTGVSVLLGVLALAVKPLSAKSSGMISAGVGLVAVAVGIKILASAVDDFSEMSWGEIAKGLLSMAGALLVIIGAIYLFPPHMAAQAAGLLLVGIALKSIASAMDTFGDTGWMEIAKGLTSLAGALVIIAGAMHIMPPTMAAQAAGLILVGIALKSIGKAVKKMGDMGWMAIAKGLTALAGSLLVLAGGLYLMSGTLPGSAALLVAAAALAIFTPTLVVLGSMSWGQIIKGLLALAGAFTVLGLAGVILGPISPVILLIAASVMVLGAGLALAGAGTLAFATALSILVGLGGAAVTMISDFLGAIISSIPAAMRAFGLGIIAFAKALAQGGPEFIKAMAKIIEQILQAVIDALPKIREAFTKLLDAGLKVIVQSSPKIVKAGMKLLTDFLGGVEKNIYQLATIAARIITKFLKALGDNMPRVIQAGVEFIIKYINGVAKAIEDNSEALGRAGGRLASAIIKGMVKGLSSGLGEVARAARDVAWNALDSALRFLGIRSPSKKFEEVGLYSDQGLAGGLLKYAGLVEEASEGVAETAIDAVKKTMTQMADVVSGEVDIRPVISPVLDLTSVKRDAAGIDGLFGRTTISAKVSTGTASTILNTQTDRDLENLTVKPLTPANINFQQINNSPKALSAIEIYRNTRSQLAMAKEALSV